MNDDAIVQLLTEIRDNQVRDIHLREQLMQQSRDAGAKLGRWTTVLLAGLACFVAFEIWRMHRTGQRIEEWQERREQAEWEELEPI